MNIVERAKNILLSPAKEWDVIKGETTPIADLFTKYAAILAAIPAVAGFIGFSMIGVRYAFGSFRWPIGSAFTWMILMYIFSLAGVFAIGFILDALAPSFGAAKDLPSSMRVAVYGMTASWVAGIFQIIPVLGILAIIGGLYSLYLFYLGIQKVKTPPADKLTGYFIVTLVVSVIVIFLVMFISNSIVGVGPMVRGF